MHVLRRHAGQIAPLPGAGQSPAADTGCCKAHLWWGPLPQVCCISLSCWLKTTVGRRCTTRDSCLPAAGPIDCVKKTVQWEGLRGLYKASAALLDVMPWSISVLWGLLPAAPLRLSLLHLSTSPPAGCHLPSGWPDRLPLGPLWSFRPEQAISCQGLRRQPPAADICRLLQGASLV